DFALFDPDEVGGVDVTVGPLYLDPKASRAGLLGARLSILDLAQYHLAVAQRELNQLLGPKDPHAVDQYQGDHAGDHQQAKAEGSASEPDVRLSGGPKLLLHSELYRLLSLNRTTSATVLRRKVSRKSNRALRKSTRNSEPPAGASGSSTAILAESARNPLKIFQLMIGVLPVAISTIIVSPTARPSPTIIAEKIPGLAVGTTTRNAVCHLFAPRARPARTRCRGTLEKASSAIVKMIGITAKPIAMLTTSELRWS